MSLCVSSRVLSSLARAAERQMLIYKRQTRILSMYCNFRKTLKKVPRNVPRKVPSFRVFQNPNIHRPRTITEFHQTMVYIIGLFTYFTHIAVHYLSYTVHQISLYGSVQSQQSLFITYWLYICVYKC